MVCTSIAYGCNNRENDILIIKLEYYKKQTVKISWFKRQPGLTVDRHTHSWGFPTAASPVPCQFCGGNNNEKYCPKAKEMGFID